jgi:hypothetical protein
LTVIKNTVERCILFTFEEKITELCCCAILQKSNNNQ